METFSEYTKKVRQRRLTNQLDKENENNNKSAERETTAAVRLQMYGDFLRIQKKVRQRRLTNWCRCRCFVQDQLCL